MLRNGKNDETMEYENDNDNDNDNDAGSTATGSLQTHAGCPLFVDALGQL